MLQTSTLTIVFRGLLIFRHHREAGRMEIGLLRAADHFPRILTIKNSVMFAVDLIPPAFLDDAQSPVWELVADDPARPGVDIYTGPSESFDRKTNEDERDFRWIMDLEGQDFYKRDLSEEVQTSKLMPLIHVPQGQFYTRLKSPFLLRQEGDGGLEDFGAVAAVVGCDIEVNGGGAELRIAGGPTVFTFRNEPNTIYEFTNTPPDVRSSVGTVAPHHHAGHDHAGHDHAGHGHGEHAPAGAWPSSSDGPTAGGDPASAPGSAEFSEPGSHFQHYYSLFPRAFTPRFSFQMSDASPAPDPALCGSASLGTRQKPLGQD